MEHHRTIGKALECLEFHLRNRHTWYWQRPWEELSYQEQQDILDEFALHEDYAKCGVWKSERHRRAEERRFLFDITRRHQQLPDTLTARTEHKPINLAWLMETELPAPLAQLVYILYWSNQKHPGGRYQRLLDWMKQGLDPEELGVE
jgi:hypothetical protein